MSDLGARGTRPGGSSVSGPQKRFRLSSAIAPAPGPLPESVAWGAVNTLISGLIGFGLPGWLLDRWLGTNWIVMVGLLVGMTVALTIVWFRYGTDRSASSPPAEAPVPQGAGSAGEPGTEPGLDRRAPRSDDLPTEDSK